MATVYRKHRVVLESEKIPKDDLAYIEAILNEKANRISQMLKGIYTSAYHKFYIDEIYLFITKKIVNVSSKL